MSRDKKIIGVYFIDKQDQNHVVELEESDQLSATDKALMINNVCFPFAFHKGIQPCDEELFEEFKQYL